MDEKCTQIFNWLENTMNNQKLFYFKSIDDDNIGAYFKNNDKLFCIFYVDVLKRIIKEK